MGRQHVGWVWDLPLLGVIVAYVLLSPYTKVEESFGLQAAHDILQHGRDLPSYDHQQFPGVVPRTFLGALVTSAVASPAVLLGLAPLLRLYAVRLAVGLLSWVAQARLRAALSRSWGHVEGRCFAVLCALQFHLPFYMSRTLPNTFAMMLACLSHAELVGGCGYRALAILGFTAAVVRCDVLVLIAPAGLTFLAQARVNFFKAAVITAAAAAFGAVSSICIDTVFWGRLIWPELEVLLFNTAENKSSEWGVSPPLWYFYSAVPRALLGALPLALVGAALERRARGPLIIALTFTGLYSFLPHKELRFLFPALPLLNVAAAAGCARLLRMKGFMHSVAVLGLMGLVVVSFAATVVFAGASIANYPGGVALTALHRAEPASPPLRVHIGNLAAMTGVSRFLEQHPNWTYSKEEHLSPEQLFKMGFDRLLTEWPEVPGYKCQATVLGFERIELLRDGTLPPIAFRRVPKVYVLSRGVDGETHACGTDAPVWN